MKTKPDPIACVVYPLYADSVVGVDVGTGVGATVGVTVGALLHVVLLTALIMIPQVLKVIVV